MYSNLSQLERWQQWLNIHHYWPAHKHSTLQANQSYNEYTSLSRSDHQCAYAVLQSSGVHYDISKFAIHIQVLNFTVLLSRDQKEAIYIFPPSNRWLDRETNYYNRRIPQSICQLRVRWFGKAIANGGICLQQCQDCQHWSHSIQTQLWLPLQRPVQKRFLLPLEILLY